MQTQNNSDITGTGNQAYQFSPVQPWDLPSTGFQPKPYERHNRTILKKDDYQQGTYKMIDKDEQ